MKVTPLNQFRELQILWLFPARSSDTGTAGTGIEILGSLSARPLDNFFANVVKREVIKNNYFMVRLPVVGKGGGLLYITYASYYTISLMGDQRYSHFQVTLACLFVHF